MWVTEQGDNLVRKVGTESPSTSKRIPAVFTLILPETVYSATDLENPRFVLGEVLEKRSEVLTSMVSK